MFLSSRLLATAALTCSTRVPPRLAVAVRARPLVCLQRPNSPPLPDHLEDMVEELESGEAQLFDVREPQEWASGHLKLAKLVPLSELMEGEVPKYDRSLLTYVHCAAGVRVHNAAPVLEAMGFERVVPLPEGFATLAGLGFEYE